MSTYCTHGSLPPFLLFCPAWASWPGEPWSPLTILYLQSYDCENLYVNKLSSVDFVHNDTRTPFFSDLCAKG
jgi:hypothetical protein